MTTQVRLNKIKRIGLRGSKWPKDNDFSQSFSDPFKLYKNGAVFCYPSLKKAKENADLWGSKTVILQVHGEGVKFYHEEQLETQIAIRANTAKWIQIA